MKIYLGILSVLLLASCNRGNEAPDAYGNFSATEILVSAESSGKVLLKAVEEGDRVKENDLAYVIDTVQTHLKINELQARRRAVLAKRLTTQAQVAVIDEQAAALESDINRFKEMLPKGAISQKQYDDAINQQKVLQRQKEQVKTNFSSINAEVAAIDASLQQAEDILARSLLKCPTKGTILEAYAEAGELVAAGKPLFKLANLETMELKAYFDAIQLAEMKIGDKVDVFADAADGGLRKMPGTISWISSRAEFTPKIIQTREERVSLVYAVKIKVPNDGTLHLNMPGEVKLQTKNQAAND